jgi:hypothetical protein
VPNGVVETTNFAVAGVVLFLAYIGLFGQYFYAALPEQLGGGDAAWPRSWPLRMLYRRYANSVWTSPRMPRSLRPSNCSGKGKRATSSVCPGPTTER